MNSKTFSRNIYGHIETNPYVLPPSIRFQREPLADTSVESFAYHHLNFTDVSIPSLNQTNTQRPTSNFRNLANLLVDDHIQQVYAAEGTARRQLATKYDGDSSLKEDLHSNLIVKPLNRLNSQAGLQKENRKNGINLLNSTKSSKSLPGINISSVGDNYDPLKEMQHLAWQKCALNDNRCLGFDLMGERANEVTVCFKGHVKKNYL